MVNRRLTSTPVKAMERETVLDRKVFIQNGIVEVPQVPPLCDTLKLEKRHVNVGDCELFCETEGDGQALVLIMGGPGCTHHGFHPHFERVAEFAKVVYYDQRGCGNSDYVKGDGYTIDQAADDLNKLRQELKIDKWTVLGWSYGGVVAQQYAMKYPEYVAGLVLVGSSPDGHRLDLQATRQFDYMSPEERKRRDELDGMHMQGSIPEEQWLYNRHLNGDWKRQSFYRPTQDDLARMVHYEWKHDPVFRESICQQLKHVDLHGAYTNCPIPVLLVEGTYDITFGADKTKKFQTGFPGSKLVMFERSGHGPFADEPYKFVQVLQEFMTKLPVISVADLAQWKKQVAAEQAKGADVPK